MLLLGLDLYTAVQRASRRENGAEALAPLSRGEKPIVSPDASANFFLSGPVSIGLVEQRQKSALRNDFIRASKALLALFAVSVDIASIDLAEKEQPTIPTSGAIANVILRHEAIVDGSEGDV